MALAPTMMQQLLKQTTRGATASLYTMSFVAGRPQQQHVSTGFSAFGDDCPSTTLCNTMGGTRSVFAGSRPMHAAKVRGQRESDDFEEEYPAIAEGPPRGRFVPKTEEEVMEDHRKGAILRCMGASFGQGEMLTAEAQRLRWRFTTPAVILAAQNQAAHHHPHHEERDHEEEDETEEKGYFGAAVQNMVDRSKGIVRATAEGAADKVKAVGAEAKKSILGSKNQARGMSSAALRSGVSLL